MKLSVCWVVSKEFEVGRTFGPIFRCKLTAICGFSTLWWTWLDIKEVTVICSSCMRIWRHTREEIHLDWFVLSDLESFPHKSVHKDTICEESAGYFTQPTKSVCLCFGDLCIGLCVCSVHSYILFCSSVVHSELKFHQFSRRKITQLFWSFLKHTKKIHPTDKYHDKYIF